MLHLLSLLQTHRFWAGPELCGRLEVSPRTLRRDIDRLRSLGYLIEGTRGIEGGYRLDAGTDLPPLLLEDEEAIAIAVGLRSAADGPIAGIGDAALRALAKVEQVLPARLRRRVDDFGRSWVPMAGPPPLVDWSRVATITQACRDRVRLRFDYVDRAGVATSRVVEPDSLVSSGRRWYLVGWDVARTDWRTFRVDRFGTDPEPLTGFNPRTVPGGDAAAFVAAGIETLYRQVEGFALVHASAAEVAEAAGWFGGQVDDLGGDRCRIRLPGESVEWVAAALGLLGADFDVEGPPELAEHVAEVARRYGRAVSPRD